jgi:CDP-diglyceride synthetase
MRLRNAILSVIGAFLVGAAVYLDRFPRLYDLPLLGLVLVATLASLQEFTRMAARKALYLPISAMNLAGALVVLFVYYFREPVSTEPFRPSLPGPEPLLRQAELAMSILLAILALVLTTTLITYATTRRRAAVRELLLGAGSTAYLAGGLSYALLLEYLPVYTATVKDGLLTLVVLLAAAWGGESLASLVDGFLAPAALPPQPGPEAERPGEAALNGQPVRRKKRRSRGKSRLAPAPQTAPRESFPFWKRPTVQALGMFLVVLLGRDLWGLELREALVGGLGVGGALLAYRYFQQAGRPRLLDPASRNGSGPALEPPRSPLPRTLVGALAGLAGTVLIFDLLAERWLGLSLPSALLTGLAIGLAGRFGGRLLYAAKRAFQVRETGSLLPGYGGLLDRLGSLFLALPAAYYCLRWIGPP